MLIAVQPRQIIIIPISPFVVLAAATAASVWKEPTAMVLILAALLFFARYIVHIERKNDVLLLTSLYQRQTLSIRQVQEFD